MMIRRSMPIDRLTPRIADDGKDQKPGYRQFFFIPKLRQADDHGVVSLSMIMKVISRPMKPER
jgi:hypothetical protein